MSIDLPEFVVTPDDDTTTGGSESEAGAGNSVQDSETPPLDPPAAVPPNTSRFPDSEIATLEVNGKLFTHWESIWLQYQWHAGYAFFRFIAAEAMPPPPNWTLLQFVPGNNCTVTLAQQPALTGVITDRQTSYDAERHQVQLVGKSNTHWGYKSSVDNPTGSFDGQTLEQIFETVLAKYPAGKPKVIGLVNPLPFPKVQNEPGELTWDFLERLARPKGAILGADNFGNYLLIGDHEFPVLANLTEGVNIKACECLISHEQLMTGYDSRAQGAGDDQNNGSATNELQCVVAGTAAALSKLITPMETPASSKAEVCDHAYNVAKWHEGDKIIANIVVYGWTWDGKHLWEAGQNVMVNTPMAMLNMVMSVRTVTFEQNDTVGTQTTLELVAPWGLNDTGSFDSSTPGAPQAPTPDPEGTPAGTPGQKGIGSA